MNNNEIKKAFSILKDPGETIEVRVMEGKHVYSGYFKDIDNLIKCLKPFNGSNIYFALNKVNDACYNREQCEKFKQSPKTSTTDNDIEARTWFLIDIDPQRTTGVSSTDDEKMKAKLVAMSVMDYLNNVGFSKPVICDSGNGWHLLYKIAMKNNEENRDIIKNTLIALDILFSNEDAVVDTSVFNAARITKMYGTTARKGSNTKERPHRESKIITIPDKIETTSVIYFKKVMKEIPEKEKPNYKNNYNSTPFDIDEFITKHGIKVNKVVNTSIGKKYVLDECVFDSNHKAPDACIFVLNNGAIGYKCFHNSCQQYTWQDVRKKFEPNAYDKREYQVNSHRTTRPYNSGTTIEQLTGKKMDDNKPTGNAFLQLSEIEAIDRSKIVTIPSGYHELDKKIIGFNKGEISVWSGKNGSAKSTILNQLCLNAVQIGFKAALFSGELTKQRMKQWIQTQCAGKNNVMPTSYENLYYVPKEIGKQIDEWLDGKLWVYNNDFGNKFENVLMLLKEFCDKNHPDVIVLDNLMALDILTLNGDKYQQQTTMILALTDFAKTYNVHLHIVCHPRKAVGFLRKDDISGTADLTNAVDNVFIVHRANLDFFKYATEFFGEITVHELEGYDNIIEVCKNRDLGVMDLLVGLYFDIPSKRLLNSKDENVCYGWQATPTRFIAPDYDLTNAQDSQFFSSFDEFEEVDMEDGDLPF